MKLHPNVPIIITNHQTSEMIKYANNAFLATKISFINQLSNICQKIPGANIDDIGATMGLDPRIGKLFLNAGPGYGGSCLPKDMRALINFANISGINPTLLNAVEELNTKQLEQIILITKEKLGNLTSKKITILGTAFKPNTDDIRDSIAIELIKKLLKKKARITIHDPKAMKNTKRIFEEKINYAETMKDALSKSECVIIMTQWKQYEKLNNNEFKYMKRKFVIDCRRMLAKKTIRCRLLRNRTRQIKLKYIVTGGAGFIGSNIVKKLVSRGDHVIVIDNLNTGNEKNLSSIKDKIVFFKDSILNLDLLEKQTQGIDGVFHQAALASVQDSLSKPEEYHNVNVIGTENILKLAKKK